MCTRLSALHNNITYVTVAAAAAAEAAAAFAQNTANKQTSKRNETVCTIKRERER